MLPIIRMHPGNAWEWGRNARNTAFTVEIAEKVAGSWLGILAQEVFESRFKWRRGLIGTLLVTAWHEHMELVGHAIEARVAERYDHCHFDGYLYAEALALVDPASSYQRKGLFRGQSLEQVLQRLRQVQPEADDWIRAHAKEIYRWRLRYDR